MVRDVFNQLAERREWTWRIGHGSLYPPNYPTVFSNGGWGMGGWNQGGFGGSGGPPVQDVTSMTPGSYLVTSSNGIFTPDMVGKQYRAGGIAGTSFPTYTLAQYLSAYTFLLDTPWVGPALTNQQYIIFQCYFPMPADFQSWISLTNTTNNYRLWTNTTQSEIDAADPQRVQTGITFCASYYDLYQSFIGVVGAVIQVAGFGSSPISTTDTGYTFPQDSVYSIQIQQSGTNGIATYTWKQDQGTNSPILTSSPDLTPVSLSNGVQVVWPVGEYNAGDVFVIVAKSQAEAVTGQMRWELWPRPINAQYVYPYLYKKILPDLSDANPQLPPTIAWRGDVLLEMVLAQVCEWPGTDTQRNVYYDMNAAARHSARAEKMINELEVADEDTAMKYLTYTQLDMATSPYMDGSFLQRHALGPYTGF